MSNNLKWRSRQSVWATGIAGIGVAVLSLGQSPTLAHDGEDDHQHTVPVVQPAEMYEPTPMPDRIVLSWNNDPRTTQAVSWRTSTDIHHALAEIAVADGGPAFPATAEQVKATTEALETDINTAHFHSVSFDDLSPGTTYAYRVGDGTNWSEWFHFRTATAKPEPFSFIYFGDAQNSVRSMWSRVIREAQRDAPKAAFLLHAGDLVNRAESDAEWGEWCGAGGWLNAMMPNIAIPGNHEQAKKEDGTRRLSHHWRKQFTLPENGPAGLEETCFTMTYHNVRIVALNSNEQQAEQAAWLEGVLTANESPWIVCTFHHPIFSTGKDRDNPELRALWKPLFDKHKVDLVLQGHDHTYGRTGLQVPHTLENEETAEAAAEVVAAAATQEPGGSLTSLMRSTVANVPTGVQAIDKETGTVYVVSVSGPKMYNNNRKSFMKRLAEDTQLYQIIHVDGDSLRFEARTAVGELYDAFELKKQPGTINKLIELEPEIAERMRDSQP